MFATLFPFSGFEPDMVVQFLLTLLVAAFVQLAIVGGILYLLYFVLTLPMRRTERARVFLDLIELGLKDGLSAEQAIVDAASSRDRSLGARLHLAAAYLQKGFGLGEALARVPRLVPPQLVAMLNTGARIGDVAKVLPACRQILNDSVSQVRGALNYLLVLTFLITPSSIFVPLMLAVFVLPKFKEVFNGMLPGSMLPAFSQFIFSHTMAIVWTQVVLLVLIWILMLGYVGGPRLRRWAKPVLGDLPDGLLYRLPWRRKRLQRDFSAMLAVLLDSSVPEMEAVALAAEATDNSSFRSRARDVCRLLGNGVRLPDALRLMDESGELHWRISNALQRGSGFLRALSGWHEALDAKAFQLEQTAAQMATSALVLFNGFVVAAIVIGTFIVLLQVLNGAVLW